MTETIQYVRRVGGSLMVTIPKEIVDLEGIHEGEMLKINVERVKKDWFGAAKGLSSLKKEDKVDIKWEKFEHHG